MLLCCFVYWFYFYLFTHQLGPKGDVSLRRQNGALSVEATSMSFKGKFIQADAFKARFCVHIRALSENLHSVCRLAKWCSMITLRRRFAKVWFSPILFLRPVNIKSYLYHFALGITPHIKACEDGLSFRSLVITFICQAHLQNFKCNALFHLKDGWEISVTKERMAVRRLWYECTTR